MEDKIRARLQEIRTFLQSDGGDLEVVSINGKNVNLKLVGSCGSCPHSMITLKDGIERDLREQIDPEILVSRVS